MPQGEENAPTSPEGQELADFAAGWDSNFGPAPFEHGLPVDGLEISQTAPEVTG